MYFWQRNKKQPLRPGKRRLSGVPLARQVATRVKQERIRIRKERLRAALDVIAPTETPWLVSSKPRPNYAHEWAVGGD